MCHALEKMCQCTAKCVDEKKHWYVCIYVATYYIATCGYFMCVSMQNASS